MPRLRINGQEHDLALPGSTTLLAVLRDQLNLTGAKAVCERGECGACTVLLDGRAVYSCLTLAAACETHEITTIEGLGTASPHAVQRAFARHDALQCGYCTPGQILAAVALLNESVNPSDDEIRQAMSGNLCRCGTYQRILAAVREAAQEIRAGE
jgi:xanthine dehydrogenase YagT iron-sulfur-binding subunit